MFVVIFIILSNRDCYFQKMQKMMWGCVGIDGDCIGMFFNFILEVIVVLYGL